MSKLWGGRFSKKTHPLVEKFSNSIHFDYKLAKYDCIGSRIHITVLKNAKLITSAEYKKLDEGLKRIQAKAEKETLKPNSKFEDIHSYIQDLLEKDKRVGKAALKLHTCRSRNDQVALATKLYCLDNINKTCVGLSNVNRSISSLAKKHKNTVIPGYTHLQRAIPVSLGDHFSAYANMFDRDYNRLYANIYKDIELTFGSGALAGTMINAKQYNLGAHKTLKELKITNKTIKPSSNSMDSVSDRDYIIDILSALSTVAMHTSRLAEDLILWASSEFNFVDIDESFCTGSSLMPQKKNPDALELIRGQAGPIYGNLMSVLTTMKGLPLTYNRDMQLDKEPLFESFETIQIELDILTDLLKGLKFNKQALADAVADEALYATDLADHLVKNGVAFKDAHKKIGALIKYKSKTNKSILEMSNEELAKIDPSLTVKAVKAIINPQKSISSKKSVRKKR